MLDHVENSTLFLVLLESCSLESVADEEGESSGVLIEEERGFSGSVCRIEVVREELRGGVGGRGGKAFNISAISSVATLDFCREEYQG